MSTVGDSTPLIHLPAISELALLRDLFTEVSIPPAVLQEVVIRGRGRPGCAEVDSAIGDWITVQSPRLLIPAPAELKLGAGEWEAISLASELGPRYLLMDDREAVEFARSLGIAVLTTPLLLGLAKEVGLIGTVKGRLDALRTTGFWLQERAYQRILQACGED